MSQAFAMTNLKSVLRFPFQSRESKNRFLTGAILSLAGMFIPLLPVLVMYGYVARVMRQAVRGEEMALPAWDNWGQLAYDGLRSAVVGLLYVAPGLLVMVLGFGLYFVTWFGGIVLLDNDSPQASPAAPLFLIFAALAVLFLSMFLGGTLSFAGLAPLPAALAHFVARDRVAAAFDLPGWWRLIRSDPWGYFSGWVILLGLAGVSYLAFMAVYFTGILCFLGYLLAAPFGFYLFLVSAVVFGRFYREAAAGSSGAAA